MNFRHYIYGLICPIDKQVVYVGRTVSPKSRLSEHFTNNSVKCLKSWYMRLKAMGKRREIEIVILETIHGSFSDANKVEKKWILKYSKSEPLLNLSGNKSEQHKLKAA